MILRFINLYVEGPISVGRSVPEGSYALTLHFAEPDDDVKAGDRVFAVAVEESQQLDALDVVLFRDGRARSACNCDATQY